VAEGMERRCRVCGEMAYYTVSGAWRHIERDPYHDVDAGVDRG
jgi:hypothetical protein